MTMHSITTQKKHAAALLTSMHVVQKTNKGAGELLGPTRKGLEVGIGRRAVAFFIYDVLAKSNNT
jgi:hypothetical protein